MSSFSFQRAAVLATAALTLSLRAAAQPTAPQNVLVTGNPLRSAEVSSAASVLAGDELVRRRGASVAETLDGLPGLAASYFGPNASRPIIRGQDGDRIRLLGNGGASFDASALSSDHAVPIDPLVVERIEVLRGPAALMYGGGAIGGVVNLIDNRIPTAPLGGSSVSAELRLGGAAAERALAALAEGGRGGWSWHADAFARRTGDLAVPAFERAVDGELQRRRRVANSDSRAEGGAFGGSYAWRDGYLGLSLDGFRTRYGSVAEDAVRLHMSRERFAAAGEWRALPGPIETWRVQASATDYRHDELEDGQVGTTFTNRGSEMRVEAVHRALALAGGRLQGVLGVQAEGSRFEALGDEAFVPSTRTRHSAAFLVETWHAGALAVEAGARAEQVRVDSRGDAAGSDEPRFGAAQSRRFSPRSTSLALRWRLPEGWSVEGSWAATQRAPTSYELYANGVHVATAAFERGRSDQALERARHAELGLAWEQGSAKLQLSMFHSRFANYIVLLPSGESFEGEAGEALPVFDFAGVRARLAGAELQARWEMPHGDARLAWSASLDTVRGDNLASGQALPRIAPRRARLGLAWHRGPWQVGVEVRHAARQSRVPGDDSATPAWTQLDVQGSWSGQLAGPQALWFLRAGNLTDRLAFNASTIATVRGLVPLAGRSLRAGLRLSY